jgi:hypothetical protein
MVETTDAEVAAPNQDARVPRRRSWRISVLTFAASLVVCLAIVVPAAYAVGWVGIQPTDHTLVAFEFIQSGCCVYSQQMRVWQNQSQVDSGDPVHQMEYWYPSYAEYAVTNFFWNSANPFNWNQNGGNKRAVCDNPTSQNGGRLITCQYYSTV